MNVQMFGKPTRPFPPLPKKMMIGNQASKVVEERQVCIALKALFQNRERWREMFIHRGIACELALKQRETETEQEKTKHTHAQGETSTETQRQQRQLCKILYTVVNANTVWREIDDSGQCALRVSLQDAL